MRNQFLFVQLSDWQIENNSLGSPMISESTKQS